MFETLLAVATGALDAANVLAIGPPGGLPGTVPDFVGGLLDQVGAFVDGSTSDLGSAVSDTASGADPSAGAGGPPGTADSAGSGS